MNAILYWFNAPEWSLFVKTLIHSLWQGALIALALALTMRRVVCPHWRYRFSLLALVMIPAAAILTWTALKTTQSSSPISEAQPVLVDTVTKSALSGNPQTKSTQLPNHSPAPRTLPWTGWLALMWIVGASAMLGRTGIKLAGAERLRCSSQPLENPLINQLLVEAQRAVGLTRRIRLTVTDKLTSPVVVGVLVPTLILPLSLLTTLTPEQVRFILLHELAHVRRGDYLANLFQLFVEAALFFNPAIWWISHQMRREREACCDLLAIQLSGAPADYARTLVHVAETALTATPEAAPGFSDKREPSSLADRVQRVLVPGYRPSLRLTWRAMITAFILGTALLVVTAEGTRIAVAQISKPSERVAEEKTTRVQNEEPKRETAARSSRSFSRFQFTGPILASDQASFTEDRQWIWQRADPNTFRDVTFNLGPPSATSQSLKPRSPITLTSGNSEVRIDPDNQIGMSAWTVDSRNHPGLQWFSYRTGDGRKVVDVNSSHLTNSKWELSDALASPLSKITPSNSTVWFWYPVTNRTLITNGGVVRRKDTVIQADSIQFDANSGQITASGNVQIQAQDGVTKASTAALDLPASPQPAQANSSGSSQNNSSRLRLRTFKIDTNAFWQGMESVVGAVPLDTNETETIRIFFNSLGVDLSPPKNLQFKADLGELSIQATEADLDVIQAVLETVSTLPPQVSIKARFVEIEDGSDDFLRQATGLNKSELFANSAYASGLTRILTEQQFRPLLEDIRRRKGISLLAEQEVTTLTGRQAQMQSVKVGTILNGVDLPASGPALGLPDTDTTNRLHGIRVLPFGAVLDVVASVPSDGYTIHMMLSPTFTEFLGYDDPDGALPQLGQDAKETFALPLPRMRIRQSTNESVVWDGQTVVLVVMDDRIISKRAHGDLRKDRNSDPKRKPLVVFITATLVDKAGNRVHSEADILSIRESSPPK